MKKIKFFFEKPLIVILISLILAYISYNYLSNGLLILIPLFFISAMFLTSLIFIIRQKKWFKLVLSIIGFFLFFVIWVSFLFFRGLAEPNIELGDNKFYTNEIAARTELKIPSNLQLVSKIDTIIYIGPGGEYHAECVYYGSKKIISKLKSSIDNNKSFKKDSNISDFQTIQISQKDFPLKDINAVYKQEIEGFCNIVVAFNESKTKIYYSAWYN